MLMTGARGFIDDFKIFMKSEFFDPVKRNLSVFLTILTVKLLLDNSLLLILNLLKALITLLFPAAATRYESSNSTTYGLGIKVSLVRSIISLRDRALAKISP